METREKEDNSKQLNPLNKENMNNQPQINSPTTKVIESPFVKIDIDKNKLSRDEKKLNSSLFDEKVYKSLNDLKNEFNILYSRVQFNERKLSDLQTISKKFISRKLIIIFILIIFLSFSINYFKIPCKDNCLYSLSLSELIILSIKKIVVRVINLSPM